MTAPAKFNIGDVVLLAASFEDPANGNRLVDPGAVTCKVQDPQGQTTTPPVTHDSTGKYHAEYGPTIEGIYYYRFEGTAPWEGASPDGQFEVGSTVFTPGAPGSRPPS